MQVIKTTGRQYDKTIIIQPKLMNEKRVNEEYGFTLSWLRNARWKGDGPPFVKIGGGVFYRPEDMDAFILKHLRNSTSEY